MQLISTFATSSIVLLSLCFAALAQTTTMELRTDEADARIYEFGLKSGVVLTNEAISAVKDSVGTGNDEMLATMIGKFPVIHVIVSPVPPRDYTVVINGRRYEATEESKYGVRPGSVDLMVERGALRPCIHKLVVHQDRDVECEMKKAL